MFLLMLIGCNFWRYKFNPGKEKINKQRGASKNSQYKSYLF